MGRTVRIIGGQYKKSTLPVLEIDGFRPTPDRVRETLYNWIDHFWYGVYEDKSVLDLFAGTGALGFEATSRGARYVLLSDQNPKVIEELRKSRDKLKADAVRINSLGVPKILERMDASRFDLVLLDPPFNSDLLETTKPYLEQILLPQGLVYIESNKPQTLNESFELLRESKAGQVYFYLFKLKRDNI
ncbi:16S rRNA (guanine(966)-N(2))-methyltransferase RsmD [Taylorella equigenitalis]|uniref:Ribosomal RNA small subunit methyltransferase D n=2 Tax=Taylorella equigenitalis TaxID=29575 RepID=A0A654KHI6_TAYEM|nr:16S rRNA (guanine(966)-N(2))-methyltransferase RsmD [Taylorella equigenitalis]ADU91891.1 Ribosomal RNA small subunit methyltransferase D [Taylorella equigenitalis MCE9]AFN35455.1 hypothetical protein KUI_0363 [Taylorella equigenitalis ATCC 35865]ASY38884.1 16S rRNA (guanine(966)-N(2))-methyltransferase RsmD [Taylorella equigenitalis]ASY40405.1 16S rRNA (guanine(966)-N(2))-methyltransferase RsmD [Taylorella equigenitalis]WDU56666.1 16S rRNA (guanine(966)-N(2))-methyltransferase RsmD [Taylore